MSNVERTHVWREGDNLQFWGGRDRGWVSATVISVSVRGAPTVIDPITGKRRTFYRDARPIGTAERIP